MCVPLFHTMLEQPNRANIIIMLLVKEPDMCAALYSLISFASVLRLSDHKRIERELPGLKASPPPPCVINVEPNQHDSFTWIVVKKGHDNTVR